LMSILVADECTERGPATAELRATHDAVAPARDEDFARREVFVARTTGAVDASVLADLEEMQEEGEPDFVAELIGLYLEDAPRKLAQMREAARAADAAALRRAAHGLKGGSASLGAFGVAAVCAELERACRDDYSSQAPALLARLARELERAHLAFEGERRRRCIPA